MEIDPLGRMWIIDAGILNLFVPEIFEWHTPKLLVVNVTTGAVLRQYEVHRSMQRRDAAVCETLP